MSEVFSNGMVGDLKKCAELSEQLARAAYRLTDCFPDGEPIRKKIREAALEIIIALTANIGKEDRSAHHAVAAMLALLRIAQAQQFAHEENFMLLMRSYAELSAAADSLATDKENVVMQTERAPARFAAKTTASPVPTEAPTRLSKRQKEIAAHFKSKESFQLREVRQLFEGYSQKTLRNDLKELCRLGILRREGVGTVSFYKVIGNAT